MLRLLGRRGLEAVISGFALLGFCYVPLGGHTGLEHTKAILSTPAAKRAGAELAEAFAKIRARLSGQASEFASSELSEPSAIPGPSGPPRHHHRHATSEPKARLPELGERR